LKTPVSGVYLKTALDLNNINYLYLALIPPSTVRSKKKNRIGADQTFQLAIREI
jgi:hypothetical protein